MDVFSSIECVLFSLWVCCFGCLYVLVVGCFLGCASLLFWWVCVCFFILFVELCFGCVNFGLDWFWCLFAVALVGPLRYLFVLVCGFLILGLLFDGVCVWSDVLRLVSG